MAEALRIAIVGAESTGKTVLARALAERIGADTGLRCAWVGEHLREWCDRAGRTPRADEQAAIARTQQARIDEAAQRHEVVVCDTTPLMTAVYSRIVFGDRSLDALAVQAQRGHALTLLTALDLPWVADPQRDGPHVRLPVDEAVRDLLTTHALPWALVGGQGAARVQAALDAVTPLLRPRARAGAGLFTRLAEREAAQPAWRGVCTECDDPDCEHQAWRHRRA